MKFILIFIFTFVGLLLRLLLSIREECHGSKNVDFSFIRRTLLCMYLWLEKKFVVNLKVRFVTRQIYVPSKQRVTLTPSFNLARSALCCETGEFQFHCDQINNYSIKYFSFPMWHTSDLYSSRLILKKQLFNLSMMKKSYNKKNWFIITSEKSFPFRQKKMMREK